MTINQQTLKGNWNEIKGKLHDRWGEISDDDWQRVKGNAEQVVGLIQRKTGEAREIAMQYLEELTQDGASMACRATEAVKQYATQAADTLQETTRQAADSVRAGYDEAERMVRTRPAESLAACFGLGLITGVVVGLALRR